MSKAFTPGRLLPSVVPDTFAGLPVLLSAQAVAAEFHTASPCADVEWRFGEEDAALGGEEIRVRMLAPMEACLRDLLVANAPTFRGNAVTFDVRPPVVLIQLWGTPAPPAANPKRTA